MVFLCNFVNVKTFLVGVFKQSLRSLGLIVFRTFLNVSDLTASEWVGVLFIDQCMDCCGCDPKTLILTLKLLGNLERNRRNPFFAERRFAVKQW